LLQEVLAWARFVVMPYVHQYVVVAGDHVLGVMTERLVEEVI
jgi:hypothetical protein